MLERMIFMACSILAGWCLHSLWAGWRLDREHRKASRAAAERVRAEVDLANDTRLHISFEPKDKEPDVLRFGLGSSIITTPAGEGGLVREPGDERWIMDDNPDESP